MFKLFLNIIFSCITLYASIFCGFAPDTLILTPTGYQPIQNIKKDDHVISITKNGIPSVTTVSHVVTKTNQKHIKVTFAQCSSYNHTKKTVDIADQTITVACSQKFLRVCNHTWIKAKDLKPDMIIFVATLPGTAKIKTVTEYFNGITLYDLNLKHDHVFCITQLNIIVHNYALLPTLWFNSVGYITTLSSAVAGAGITGAAATLLNVAIPVTCIASAAMFVAMGGIAQSQIFTEAPQNQNIKPENESLKFCGSSCNQACNSSGTTNCHPTQQEFDLAIQCGNNIALNSLVSTSHCIISDANAENTSCGYSPESLPIANQSKMITQDTTLLQTQRIETAENDSSANNQKSPKPQNTDETKTTSDPLPVENPSIMKHIFRNEAGHMIDTPENRDLLRNLVQDKQNSLGEDLHKNEWYGKILNNGKQLWAWMRNNIIRDGGLNETPRPFNNRTGLCNENAIKK